MLLYMGYLAHQNPPPPYEHHRAQGVVLLQGPRGVPLFICEVPLYVTLLVRAGIAGRGRILHSREMLQGEMCFYSWTL